MIHAVIVEDDPMVAQINRQYLLQLGDFKVDGIFSNGQDALEYLRLHQPELVILDVYMPSISGSELLRKMRAENIRSSVIMVTAATEARVVDEALRLGIVDYLIKPYSFSRFQEAVQRYLTQANLLKSAAIVDQTMVDKLLSSESSATEAEQSDLRKGLNQMTLSHIREHLCRHPGEKYTCESISAASGLSKVTVRRYLNYMIETGQVLSSIDYETGGRPRVLYRMK